MMPDRNLLDTLYGPQPPVPSNDPFDVVLESMYARKRHLDLLIALIEMERPKSQQTPGA